MPHLRNTALLSYFLLLINTFVWGITHTSPQFLVIPAIEEEHCTSATTLFCLPQKSAEAYFNQVVYKDGGHSRRQKALN